MLLVFELQKCYYKTSLYTTFAITSAKKIRFFTEIFFWQLNLAVIARTSSERSGSGLGVNCCEENAN